MCVTIFYNYKTLFQVIKKVQQVEKTEIFPKQLTNGFGPKMALFPWFFLNISQGNVFYDILKRKNAFLGYKHKKIKKLRFFQKG